MSVQSELNDDMAAVINENAGAVALINDELQE